MPLKRRFDARWEIPLFVVSIAAMIALAVSLMRKALADRIDADGAVDCGKNLCHLSFVDFRDATWRPVSWLSLIHI